MGKFVKIKNDDIKAVLETTNRQYFVGNLARPQIIEHISDERIEIGISSYDVPTVEPAHKHSIATEYQYVISGITEYMDVDTNEVFRFTTGDFYAILPQTAYLQKTDCNTKILFIKVPSINDKIIIKCSKSQNEWATSKI